MAYLSEDEELRRMEKLAARLEKEKLPDDLSGVDISTFIQRGTDTAALAKLVNGYNEARELASIDLYVYLRDEMGTRTVGEATEMVRSGKVEQGIVQRWIEEEAYQQKDMYFAIKEGYPQLSVPHVKAFYMTEEEWEELQANMDGAISLAELQAEELDKDDEDSEL
jgi:hypothetical protein